MVFEPISLDRQTDYLELLKCCPQVASDYSFLNLWAWADEYELRWAWQDNLVWIRQTRPQELFWAPVGPWDRIDWRARFEENRNRRTDFIRVPQQLAESKQDYLPRPSQVHIHPPRPKGLKNCSQRPPEGSRSIAQDSLVVCPGQWIQKSNLLFLPR